VVRRIWWKRMKELKSSNAIKWCAECEADRLALNKSFHEFYKLGRVVGLYFGTEKEGVFELEVEM
jgi:hypothetical protein